MEQFLSDLRTYADTFGVQPTTIIQRAGCGSGGTWAKWATGRSSPTMLTADRLRKYMADNPAPKLKEAS